MNRYERAAGQRIERRPVIYHKHAGQLSLSWQLSFSRPLYRKLAVLPRSCTWYPAPKKQTWPWAAGLTTREEQVSCWAQPDNSLHHTRWQVNLYGCWKEKGHPGIVLMGDTVVISWQCSKLAVVGKAQVFFFQIKMLNLRPWCWAEENTTGSWLCTETPV